MRFIIFVIDDQGKRADGDEMKAIDAFNEGLQKNGNWILAAGISAPSNATLIDNRNDRGEVSNSSLFSSNDFYSGFWIIEAESDERAVELAKDGSKACNRRVEVRPFLR